MRFRRDVSVPMKNLLQGTLWDPAVPKGEAGAQWWNHEQNPGEPQQGGMNMEEAGG